MAANRLCFELGKCHQCVLKACDLYWTGFKSQFRHLLMLKERLSIPPTDLKVSRNLTCPRDLCGFWISRWSYGPKLHMWTHNSWLQAKLVFSSAEPSQYSTSSQNSYPEHPNLGQDRLLFQSVGHLQIKSWRTWPNWLYFEPVFRYFSKIEVPGRDIVDSNYTHIITNHQCVFRVASLQWTLMASSMILMTFRRRWPSSAQDISLSNLQVHAALEATSRAICNVYAVCYAALEATSRVMCNVYAVCHTVIVVTC